MARRRPSRTLALLCALGSAEMAAARETAKAVAAHPVRQGQVSTPSVDATAPRSRPAAPRETAAARTVALGLGGPTRDAARWWRTSPSPANDGLKLSANATPLAAALPRPWTSSCAETQLLTSSLSVVRLLGGWKKDDANGSSDLAAGPDCALNASRLYERIDPIVDACLTPIVVFDNVPWCFSPNATVSTYGNSAGPDDVEAYGVFLEDVVEALVAKYPEARRWYYRVGTEPNYFGHWTSGFDAYAAVYDKAVAAVRGALGPFALVGPGNLPHGMNDTFAELVVAHAAATDGQVLGLSFYGGAPDGYNTEAPHRAMKWLRDLRDGAWPNATRPKLVSSEFGTLQSPSGETSPEPGAFGAAWTVSSWLVGLALDFDEFYRWTDSDLVDDETFLYGWAWAMAVAELLFDSDAEHATVEFLTTSRPMEVDDPAVARNTTSVAGLTTETSAGRAVLVAAYDPTAYFGAAPLDATLTVPLFENVTLYSLSTDTALYDRLYRDLNATGGLASDDGHLYKLKKLANDDGMAYVKARLDDYLAFQNASLAPGEFPGAVARNATHAVLSWELAVPSVSLLVTR